MDRRRFLAQSSAAASTAAIAGRAAAKDSDDRAARRVVLIGCGWYGKLDLLQLILVEPVEVVGVCDVDSKMADEAASMVAERQKSGRRPPTFDDYQTMLDETSPDIAVIGTPDHWHALPMIAAVRAGADVYVQKPTAIDTLESKAMLDAARSTGRVVQVGTQRRSTPHLIEAKREIVDAGLLGNVAFAEVCCYYHMRTRENPEPVPPPASLDYETYVGPAPPMAYNPVLHPKKWRAYTNFSNGIVGDMCVHMLDLVRWQLGLGWPTRIHSAGGILVDTDSIANISDTQTATFDFDDLKVVWTHRTWGSAPDPKYPWAAVLYGDKGTLKLSVDRYDFEPRGGGPKRSAEAVTRLDEFPSDTADVKRWNSDPTIAPAIRGHMRDFLAAVDARTRPVADIEQGHISSASCFLANLSMELGRSLRFDPATHTIIGDEAATAAMKRPYQNGYTHPADLA